MYKILVVEDDNAIHLLLKKLLEKENYEVLDAYSGTEALSIIEKEKFDLILLDLMLPGINGEEIVKKAKSLAPIVVISSKVSSEDKVNNLLNGASDYITKPFDKNELLARIQVQLRKNNYQNESLKYKDIELLKDNRTLKVGNNKTHLTKTEYAILKQLLLTPDKVITKSKLLELISFDTEDCDENSLKVHISNIRKKLRNFTGTEYIESVWGIGFKIRE